MEKRLQNRKRCLNCEHYGLNTCPLFANADVFAIDKCILEYDEVKNIKKDSIEEFVFWNSPTTYLQFLGKGKSLNVGDKVITLRGGFGSFDSGKFLTITDLEDDKYYFATDGKYDYCINKDKWYAQVFKLTT